MRVPGALHPPEGVSLNEMRSPALTFQVGCKLSLVLFQYCIMANFSWLLVEGLYLHTLLAASFSRGRRFQAYLLIGWGKAAPPQAACPAPPQPPTSPQVPAPVPSGDTVLPQEVPFRPPEEELCQDSEVPAANASPGNRGRVRTPHC